MILYHELIYVVYKSYLATYVPIYWYILQHNNIMKAKVQPARKKLSCGCCSTTIMIKVYILNALKAEDTWLKVLQQSLVRKGIDRNWVIGGNMLLPLLMMMMMDSLVLRPVGYFFFCRWAHLTFGTNIDLLEG